MKWLNNYRTTMWLSIVGSAICLTGFLGLGDPTWGFAMFWSALAALGWHCAAKGQKNE